MTTAVLLLLPLPIAARCVSWWTLQVHKVAVFEDVSIARMWYGDMELHLVVTLSAWSSTFVDVVWRSSYAVVGLVVSVEVYVDVDVVTFSSFDMKTTISSW